MLLQKQICSAFIPAVAYILRPKMYLQLAVYEIACRRATYQIHRQSNSHAGEYILFIIFGIDILILQFFQMKRKV